MQKDYIKIESDSKDKEIRFIEKFWTKRWDSSAIKAPLKAEIEASEEFKIMQPFIDKLPYNSRIFDGGCGLGKWTIYFESQGYKTVGLDISRDTIKRLNRQSPQYNFVFGDIRHTKFKSSSFQAYYSWGTFEHIEEGLKDCFQEAHRILKPKGLLFITVPYQNLRHLLKGFFTFQVNSSSSFRFYQWRLTKQELIREMKLSGFKVLLIKPIHKIHGLRQIVKCELGVSPDSILHKPLQLLLYPFLPKFFCSHMLMTVGQKR